MNSPGRRERRSTLVIGRQRLQTGGPPAKPQPLSSVGPPRRERHDENRHLVTSAVGRSHHNGLTSWRANINRRPVPARYSPPTSTGSDNTAFGSSAPQHGPQGASQNTDRHRRVRAHERAVQRRRQYRGSGRQALYSNVSGGSKRGGGRATPSFNIQPREVLGKHRNRVRRGCGPSRRAPTTIHSRETPPLPLGKQPIRIGNGRHHTRSSSWRAPQRHHRPGQRRPGRHRRPGANFGTVSSSASVKREIAEIGDEMRRPPQAKLRPCPSSIATTTSGGATAQYGLIAEERSPRRWMPDVVQYSEAGEPEMVRWHFPCPSSS
jgi:hypothetical protein